MSDQIQIGESLNGLKFGLPNIYSLLQHFVGAYAFYMARCL